MISTSSAKALHLTCLCLLLSCCEALAESPDATSKVTTLPLSSALTQIQQSAPASVISLNEGVLSSQLNAQVLSIHKQVGDAVDKGDVLVSLDCRETTERRIISDAALSLAQKEIKRARSLSTKNNIAEQALNEAETRLKQARAEARLSRIQIERCTIRAPYSGVVTKKHISVGELAANGTALVSVVDTVNVEISAQLRPSQTESLESGKTIYYFADSQRQPATIRSVSSVIDSVSHTVEVRLKFNNAPALTGSTGTIEWQEHGTFLNPLYVQERTEQLGYFVADKGVARFVSFDNGERGTPPALPNSENRDIIVSGRHSMKDGQAIEIIGEAQ